MRNSLLGGTIGLLLIGGALPAAGVAGTAEPGQSLVGRWDAALLNNGPAVPFRLDIFGSGSSLKGTFYDGFSPYETTTNASFENGVLTLRADHYLTTITASLSNGELTGKTVLTGPSYTLKYDFHAVRHVESDAVSEKPPAIAGSWEIPLDSPSPKGEKAYRLIVQQKGAEAAASILRVDGDTGAYSGAFHDGKWVLSHFDGHRPGVIEVVPTKDGTLDLVVHNEAFKRALEGKDSETNESSSNAYTEDRYAGAAHYIAYRPDVARAKGFAPPENYLTHTSVRDGSEKFKFRFPDVNGKVVSEEDFKGKVVLAIVTGTWCPNCHDEAQYLVQLDKKYRDKGLAIVALDFEEPEQQASLSRARAFVKQYGVKYPYLIAGAPAEMWEKVPQLVNLNTWPTTVFVGRDGLVKGVHSGFASPASGEFNEELKKEFTGKIEELLAQKSESAVAVSKASEHNAQPAQGS